jgi:RNA polymerase sigma-70 factor (ECF subfamily)
MIATPSFWHEYKARLRSYIMSRVLDKQAADDILQDVFLKAHTNLHTVKTPGSIKSWLFRIATNVLADYYRSQKPWTQISEESAAAESERDYVAELATCLQPLIDELPEIYRSALVLSEIKELPQKEVAKRLGISLSAAKARVQRGREKLRRRVLDCCDIEIYQNRIVGYTPYKKSNKCDCS